jgi:hypothetical protein
MEIFYLWGKIVLGSLQLRLLLYCRLVFKQGPQRVSEDQGRR